MATVVLEHYAPAINHVPLKHFDVSDDDRHHGAMLSKQFIGEAMRQRIGDIDHERCDPGDEDPFFVADLGEVYRQYQRWKLNLPRIRPFYAVKCNPDPQVLKLLCDLGTGFDCASKAEVDQVLAMGLDPDRIIYAQPCKTASYLRHVKASGVKQMTFDNGDELRKIARLYPDAQLYLRIMTDDTSSQCRLSMKFGAPMDTTDSLLSLARDLGLDVVGVSFHVGSGASDPMAFLKAVRDSHIVFEQAREYGYDLRTLDVGGGFTGETFEDMAVVLTAALDQYFPPSRNVDIIAEPGRFFVSSAFTIACHVIARRIVEDPSMAETSYMLYVNDGVYGNFSCIMFDHYNPIAKVLRAGTKLYYNKPGAGSSIAGEGTQYSIWGPTCDGIDRITESIRFDQTLDAGDWIYFENMGAYTKCSATRFNGFSDNHDVVYVCSEPGAKALMTRSK